jgi:hypothetical protein
MTRWECTHEILSGHIFVFGYVKAWRLGGIDLRHHTTTDSIVKEPLYFMVEHVLISFTFL